MRFTAVIPLFFSAPAFVILVYLAAAGMQPDSNDDLYTLHLNTSKVATNVVKFAPLTPNTTTPAANASTDPFTSLVNGASNLLSGAETAISGQIDTALAGFENTTVQQVKTSMGIQDAYRVYFRTVCQGGYGNFMDASTLNISSCSKYTSATEGFQNISNSVPRNFEVLGTNITSPLLSTVVDVLPTAGTLISVATTLNFVLLLLAIIGSGLTVLLSAFAVLYSPNWVVLVLIAASALAPIGLLVNALIVTVVGPLLAYVLSSLEVGLTITVSSGSKAVAITWASLVLTSLSAAYWVLVWFVSTRSWVLVRVERDMVDADRPFSTFYTTYRNLFYVNKRPRPPTSAQQFATEKELA